MDQAEMDRFRDRFAKALQLAGALSASRHPYEGDAIEVEWDEDTSFVLTIEPV